MLARQRSRWQQRWAGGALPAIIYVLITWGTPVAGDWGTPMATDIALALGALAVVSGHLPTSLGVLLAATAIVDDIGAVLVITFFYTPRAGEPILGGPEPQPDNREPDRQA